MASVWDPFVLSAADRRVLDAVRQLHYVTAEQAARLLYTPGSLTYTRSRLKRLSDAGYLHRFYLPRARRGGSSPTVYCLSRTGASALTRYVMPSRTIRGGERRDRSYLFLDHTLAVNEVLIAAHHLPRHVPGIRLADCRHERDLRRQPARVQLGQGKTVTVIPDGYLDFRLNDRVQVCIALELDRGTVEARAFRRKIAALLVFASGPYRSIFGTQSLTITFIVDGDAQRLARILDWTERELLHQGKQRYADLFRFARLADDIDPVALFCSSQWLRPFSEQPVPLLTAFTVQPI